MDVLAVGVILTIYKPIKYTLLYYFLISTRLEGAPLGRKCLFCFHGTHDIWQVLRTQWTLTYYSLIG